MKTLMFKIKFWIVSLAVGLLIVGSTGCVGEPGREGAEKLEQVLEKKVELIKELAEDPLIIKAVRESNQKNRDITLAEILELDDKWKNTEGLDEFIKSFITNECAQYLIDFQKANDGFPEIFVTDEKGLIVAETNKTSDYYQADEDWWINAYNEGRGKSFHGEIEYDESAQAESIALYIPVIEPETQRAIGVIKAICDITAINLTMLN